MSGRRLQPSARKIVLPISFLSRYCDSIGWLEFQMLQDPTGRRLGRFQKEG
jgi:hypothetical protein